MITRDQIQTMVDGECSDACRAELLREMESQPAAWRTLALALLEEQQWSKQISTLGKSSVSYHVSDTLPSTTLPSTSINAATTANCSLQVVPVLSLPSVELHGRLSQGPSARAFPWMSALAASLLFGFGVYGGSFLQNLSSLKSDGGETQSISFAKEQRGEKQSETIGERSIPSGNVGTDLRMLVSGPNQETSEIPIYDHKAIDHDVFVARELYEFERINQRLRKEGFELDVRPEYYTGKLNDGRQLIVPVKHIGVKPYGQ